VLATHHAALLQTSIAPEIIAERGYWTAVNWQQIDGLLFRGTQKRLECFPALVIPQYARWGDYTYSVLRWDHPRIDGKGRQVKYEQPAGVGLRLDVPRRCGEGLKDAELPLWWTEGAKKADALASKGLIAVSTPSVDSWRSPSAIPDLVGIPLKGRSVYCAYDSDGLTKSEVRKAVVTLARWMGQRGALVSVVHWPRILERSA